MQRPELVFSGAHSLNHHGRGRLWEKLGSCSSNSISEWNVYRKVETTGILYQEGSFLREAQREEVIIRIHRRGFPMNAERNFTLQLDPQLWSACISFLLLAKSWCFWCCCLSGHLVVWVIHVPTLNCLFSSNWNSWESPHWLNFVHLSSPFLAEGNDKIYYVSVVIFWDILHSISIPTQIMPICCIWWLIDVY